MQQFATLEDFAVRRSCGCVEGRNPGGARISLGLHSSTGAPMRRLTILVSAGLFATLVACTTPSSPSDIDYAVHSELLSARDVNERYVQVHEPLGATNSFLEIGFFRSADCTDDC
jgi:hypothetical protein